MLVVHRFRVADGDEAFLARASAAVAAMAERPGYRGGRVGRSPDDPAAWVVVTEWDGVGDYRRALSAYDVKVHAYPLLGEAIPEPSAYEVLWSEIRGAAGSGQPSGRAADADRAGPGRGPDRGTPERGGPGPG